MRFGSALDFKYHDCALEKQKQWKSCYCCYFSVLHNLQQRESKTKIKREKSLGRKSKASKTWKWVQKGSSPIKRDLAKQLCSAPGWGFFFDDFRSNLPHSQVESFSLPISAVLKTTRIHEVKQDFTYCWQNRLIKDFQSSLILLDRQLNLHT